MNLTILFVSIGIFIAIWVVFWFIEREFGITVGELFVWIICALAGIGMIYFTIELLI